MNGNLVAAVREAVLLWDPYGLADVRSRVPEEYDDVADAVLSNLRTVGTIEGLQAWSSGYLDGLGLRRHEPADGAFVETVWRSWRDAGQYR